MINTTVTMPGELTVTVSCEYSDDIRTIMREVMLGLKDYADECNEQKKKDETPKKGGNFSIESTERASMNSIIGYLYDEIDEYGEVTIADLKHYANVTPVYIQDRHLGVNRKRDIFGTSTVVGYKITMKNLIEVD